MGTRFEAATVVATALLLACRVSAFTCDRDDDCSDLAGGVCQAEGYCSFPDDTCESGQRFGEYSGSLSNACVPVDEQDTEITTSALTDGSTTPSPTSPTTTSSSESDGTAPVLSEGSESSTSTTDEPMTSTESASTGVDVDPTLSLWFTFDEDSSDGIVNTGTLGGVAACANDTCPLATPGVLESAGLFDAVNDCGLVDAGDMLGADAEFTVAAWVRIDAIPPGPAVIFGQAFGDANLNTWDIAVVTMGNSVWIVYEGILDALGDGVASIQTDFLDLDTWMHITATHGSDSIALWIDGDLVAQSPGFMLVSDAHPLLLGCDDDHIGTYSLFFPGALDDVRLYERVLDADEIAALAAP